MHFRQHVPNFCEGVDPYSFDFDAKEQLLDHPRVRAWQQANYTGAGAFHRYSLSPHGDEALLMAEYDGGKHWWVVGYIDDATGLDIPKWSKPKEEE